MEDLPQPPQPFRTTGPAELPLENTGVRPNRPVDGFWSISVYDTNGRYRKNEHDAYTINNLTAHRSTDGSVTVQLGGCDDTTANCLPIFPGWNYMVRLYRPRTEILNGTFTFPEAQQLTARD
jgi:hypothetical protein